MKIATVIGWGHKAGGARRTAINTLLEMARLRLDNQHIVYSNSMHTQLNNTAVLQEVLKAPSLVPQAIWDQFLFPHIAVPLAARKFKPDVIHYTNNIVSYCGSTPAVVSIYDMSPFVLPKSFVYLHGAYQRAYFRSAVKRAAKIITISENSKADICRILKIDEKKIVIIPLAANIAEEAGPIDELTVDIQTRFGITAPFILYAGPIHPRKNVGRLIDAYGQLKMSKGIPHQLVIAGSLRWRGKESIQVQSLDKVKENVIFTGGVMDSDLVNLYKNCDVFVYPSLYEGFGLPVLEAMSLGAAVVTSNISSLPEVAGDAAVLVNPREATDISRGIWKILDEPEFADKLRKKGIERAKQFSWKNTAEKVLKVLESVV